MSRALAAFVIVAGVLSGSAIAHAGAAPASMPSDDLSIERIFGKNSLIAPLPSGIEWRGGGGVSFIKKLPKDADGVARRAFVVRDVPSGKEHTLCIADTVALPDDLHHGDDDHFSIGTYAWDDAGTRVAFESHGELFMLNAGSGNVRRLTTAAGDERDPTFSPDGHMLAFVRNKDLYTMDIDKGTEVRHTTTGCDTVYNGILDWVYMEELFTRGEVRSFWWSPDGKRLAFLEIREGSMPVYPIVDQLPLDATYRLQRYPKPGDKNPVVRVGIVDARGGDITWTDVDTGDDSYIARVYWQSDSRGVAIEKLNREQNHLTLFFADAATGRGDVVMDETSPTWVNVTYLKHYYAKKRQFLFGSESDGHMHLYLHNLDGSLIRQVTKGDWEVFELAGVDEKKGRIYFTANEGDVLQRHLYHIDESGKNMKRITSEEGTHMVTMSPDFKYYIDRYSSESRPERVSVCNVDGKSLFVIGDQMSPELAAIHYAAPTFFSIQDGGRTYQCRMVKPLDFDPAKKYPVIVYVYGGPGVQVVRKVWSRHDLWHSYMASRGYIVFSIDNRGSEGRGKAWEESILERMGTLELQDQLAGVNYLKEQSYVDPERIGVWGWSYGGYMTLNAMFNAPDVFKAGVSVGPVTDWRYYDSIYTERYMKLPSENEKGYTASAPATHAENLKGSLLVMYGDVDDNVHIQNSVSLAKKLIDAGKDFDLMLFPGKEHSIVGTADRTFLYRKMTIFFDRNLKGTEPRPEAIQ
jgi:dipeptidyl-peptidase 4